MQFLLRLVDCERQYTFNNIVDTKQRAMGLLLDGIDEDVSKFLLVTKAPQPPRMTRDDDDEHDEWQWRWDGFIEGTG